jgi:hypothetical protein
VGSTFVGWFGVQDIGDDRCGKTKTELQNYDDEAGIFLLGDEFGV